MKSCANLLLLSATVVLPLPAQEGPPTPPDSMVEHRVTTLVARAWGIPSDQVRLQWGSHRLQSLPSESHIQLAGRGTHGWFAVIADPASRGAAGQVRAGVLTSTPVARTAIAVGDTLTSGTIGTETRIRWGAPDPNPATPGPGWIARRPLAPGDVVMPPAVVPPLMVRRGDPLRVVWSQEGVEVELDGRAEHQARSGDRVRVRVTGRPAMVTGIVTGPGTARLIK